MRSTRTTFRPQLEVLEGREAPSGATDTLCVNPSAANSHAPGPRTLSIAPQGCDHGIDPHAGSASNGVVSCELPT